MDNPSKCMIQCEKDGYGVHYGAWKAAQKAVPVKAHNEIPEGWGVGAYCGKPFKPSRNGKQIFCEAVCQSKAQYERRKQRKKASASNA